MRYISNREENIIEIESNAGVAFVKGTNERNFFFEKINKQ